MGGDFTVLGHLFPILLWLAAAMWVTFDSIHRNGEWGLLWGFFAFACAPLTVPIYIVCIVIADRPAAAWVQREQSFFKEQATKYKLMGDLERIKFIEAQQSRGGTLYTPGGLQPHDRGVRHFTDAEAEALLTAHDHAGAFIYLYDLYSLAVQDNDLRGQETYKHYIFELPQGRDWLASAMDKQLTPGHLKAAGIGLLESLQPRPAASLAPPTPAVAAPQRRDAPVNPKVPF